MQFLDAATHRLKVFVWDVDLSQLPPWRRRLTHLLQILYLVGRDFVEGRLSLMAMSLVYTTLLSLVPLLAVSFSVLKGFGVHNQLEPLLLSLLEPLGGQAATATQRIIAFVENINVGVLGSVGMAFLLYTVISLLQKVEESFNYAWRVKRSRSFGKRFSDYLSVILIGPVLIFSAMGITASIMATEAVQSVIEIGPLARLVEWISTLVPYLLIVLAFTFIYSFVPNTRVRLQSALAGAMVAGILWQTVGWIFASFVVGSTRYPAIYSAFATLILFMIWVYVSWTILLVGASVAFYHQHREYLSLRRRDQHLSCRLRERLGLALLYQIGRSFYRHESPWTAEALASRLRVPQESVDEVIDTLQQRGLLARTDAEPATYLPGRPLEQTLVGELLEALRSHPEDAEIMARALPLELPVRELAEELEAASDEALRSRSLRDLAAADRPEPQTGATPLRRH